MFELYDLLMTGYVAPGLVRSHIFSPGHTGLFGLPDQAAFASVTFAGLFVGTICFGYFADKFGRRQDLHLGAALVLGHDGDHGVPELGALDRHAGASSPASASASSW